MDTHLITMRARSNQWERIIQDRISSGMTIKDYCRQNNLSRDAYFYHLRRLKQAAVEKTPERFAELVPPMSPALPELPDRAAFMPQMTVEMDGVTISMNSSTPKKLLLMAMEAIRHAE